ncbi:MAG: FHA domain-containing protein [Cyanobacteria bacterium P01_D01_bin.36]
MHELSKIALVFHKDFPCSLADHTKELIASDDKLVFTIGKIPSCDIQVEEGYFSRIHATITYDSRLKSWAILDGGFYLDNGQYAASTNGIWLNGVQLKEKDPAPIEPSSKIVLGHPSAKIFVVADKYSTVNNTAWEDPGWPKFRLKKIGSDITLESPGQNENINQVAQHIKSQTSNRQLSEDWRNTLIQTVSKLPIADRIALYILLALLATVLVLWLAR